MMETLVTETIEKTTKDNLEIEIEKTEKEFIITISWKKLILDKLIISDQKMNYSN